MIREPKICAQVVKIDATPNFAPLHGEQAPLEILLLQAPLIKAHRSTAGQITLSESPSPEVPKPQGSERYYWATTVTHDQILIFSGQESEDEARFHCDAILDGDMDLSEQSDLFFLNVSSAIENAAGLDVHKEFGLLISPTVQEGQYQRVGYFEAYSRSRDTAESPQHLQESLFRGGSIEAQFYKEVDEHGRYTIEIV